MNYLLDTDIVIEYLRGNKKVVDKLIELSFEDLYLPIISLAELFYGAYNSYNKDKHLQGLLRFLGIIKISNLNFEICKHFGKIKSELRKKGKLIDNFDLLISCISIFNNQILVTNNDKHYKNIKGIKIMNIR